MAARELHLTSADAPKSVAAPAYEPNGILVADEEEFAQFEECMMNPQPPTEALMLGAKLLDSLGKSPR